MLGCQLVHPPATLDLSLEAQQSEIATEDKSQRLTHVVCGPFCCREASLTLTGGWDPLGTQVSCPLILLLGEYRRTSV